MLFTGIVAYIFKECRLTRSGLSCHENRLTGELHEFPHILKLSVVNVYLLYVIFLPCHC